MSDLMDSNDIESDGEERDTVEEESEGKQGLERARRSSRSRRRVEVRASFNSL